jgi:hypothetical protein
MERPLLEEVVPDDLQPGLLSRRLSFRPLQGRHGLPQPHFRFLFIQTGPGGRLESFTNDPDGALNTQAIFRRRLPGQFHQGFKMVFQRGRGGGLGIVSHVLSSS